MRSPADFKADAETRRSVVNACRDTGSPVWSGAWHARREGGEIHVYRIQAVERADDE